MNGGRRPIKNETTGHSARNLMLCPHGLDQRICATCRAQRPAQNEPAPPADAFADNPAPCAADPSHLVLPGERVRRIDGLGWCCLPCASAPIAGQPSRTAVERPSQASPAKGGDNGQRRKHLALLGIWLLVGVQVLAPGGWAGLLLGTKASSETQPGDNGSHPTQAAPSSSPPSGWLDPATTTTAESTNHEPTTPATSTAPPPTTTPVHAGYTEDDPEYMLRSLDAGYSVDLDDPTIDAYAGLLDILEAHCTDSRMELADSTVVAQEKVEEHTGVALDLFDVLLSIRMSIPAEAPEMPCNGVFAAWMTLTING